MDPNPWPNDMLTGYSVGFTGALTLVAGQSSS